MKTLGERLNVLYLMLMVLSVVMLDKDTVNSIHSLTLLPTLMKAQPSMLVTPDPIALVFKLKMVNGILLPELPLLQPLLLLLTPEVLAMLLVSPFFSLVATSLVKESNSSKTFLLSI